MVEETTLVRVGQKPVWAYVTACVTCFNSGCREVTVRGRGSAVAKAVDVVNALASSFMKRLIIKDIRISSDEFEEGGRKIWKPSIEIVIANP